MLDVMLIRNLMGSSIYFKLFLTLFGIWTDITLGNDLKERNCLGAITEENFFLGVRSNVRELRRV